MLKESLLLVWLWLWVKGQYHRKVKVLKVTEKREKGQDHLKVNVLKVTEKREHLMGFQLEIATDCETKGINHYTAP